MAGSAGPVHVFFAFANDLEGMRYLRKLAEERRRVRAALNQAVDAKHCAVIERANATLDEILDVFQDADYRDRIAIFHFGGHAGSDELMLETSTGDTVKAHAGGLAQVLGEQKGLELVFLNGCSSQGQVRGLLAAGVPAVVATSQAIDDEVATDFADRFYKSLSSGATIRTAFNEAEGAVRSEHGDSVRGTYRSFVPEVVAEDRCPWELFVAEGAADHVATWSLAHAAKDPLFGLPEPPRTDLPPAPFKHLHWFTSEDAEVFFGRGHEIRELYEAVTRPDAAPIILLFGASGVGKSSLLDAGLRPRLAGSHEILYLRRDGNRGLPATLASGVAHGPSVLDRGSALHRLALEAADDEVDADEDQEPETLVIKLLGEKEAREVAVTGTVALHARGLDRAWREREKTGGRPLLVILDQVEEIFTRPLAGTRSELFELVATLRRLFVAPEKRPRGRVVLSFRKEWLAEVRGALEAAKLPRKLIEVQHLGRDGIIEAVEGPCRVKRLSAYYNLEVEPLLGQVIADDLLEDQGAAVAPALQILLTKMWRHATEESPSAPRFTLAHYQRLRRRGILLDDFVDEQLEELHAWKPDVVAAGLVLDLLTFLTTSMGTAATLETAAVLARYGGHPSIPELIQQCVDRYLLVGTARVHADKVVTGVDGWGTLRLAHDTLAPVVRARFEASNLPGQRARRILLHRVVEWQDGAEGPPLDRADLALVERGEEGMRQRTEDEERLVAASRDARGARRAQRRLRKRLAVAAVVLIVAFLGVALWQQARAKAAEERAVLEAQTSRRMTDFMSDIFTEADPSKARGFTVTAVEILDQAAKKIDSELADEPALRARMMARIGDVYRRSGMLPEADSMMSRAVDTMREVFGAEHAETLDATLHLALTEQVLGRYDDAQAHYEAILGIRSRLFGAEHPDTLATQHGLATLLMRRGRYPEAEALFDPVLAAYRRTLGDESLTTLGAIADLANVLNYQGRYDEAEAFQREALAGRRGVLGDDHPVTLLTIGNLANALQDRGRYGDAEPLYREALAGQKRVLGADHHQTLNNMHNLASTLSGLGRLDEAESLIAETVERKRRVLGEEHPDTLYSGLEQGATWVKLGRFADAARVLGETLEAQQRVLREGHPAALFTGLELAKAEAGLGRWNAAEARGRDVSAHLEDILGADHGATLDAKSNLARVLAAMGCNTDAETLLRPVLVAQRRTLGDRHRDTLMSVLALAKLIAPSIPSEALDLLEELADAGQLEAEDIADPIFRKLRNDARFRALGQRAAGG